MEILIGGERKGIGKGKVCDIQIALDIIIEILGHFQVH